MKTVGTDAIETDKLQLIYQTSKALSTLMFLNQDPARALLSYVCHNSAKNETIHPLLSTCGLFIIYISQYD